MTTTTDHTGLLLRNLDLLDLRSGKVLSKHEILIEGRLIREVSSTPIRAKAARVIDLEGRTVLPGLIDCHVHINSAAMGSGAALPTSLTAAMAAKVLQEMLLRGFTTVRDVCGADSGFRTAVESGLLVGPRLYIAVDALTQTGGHGDHRPAGELSGPGMRAGSVIADGVDEVRRAVRDNLRRGADHIKLLISGGVASPTDPLESIQYSEDEIRTAVAEAAARGSYVAAHAYTDDAVMHGVTCGVRTIEHGNLIDDRAVKAMAEAGAILVPTFSPYHWSVTQGKELGLPAYHMEKARLPYENSTRSVELARKHGVKVAFGTDLFKTPHEHQSWEFMLRSAGDEPIDVLRSATLTGAEVVGAAGRLGEIRANAFADLIAVDGNPADDLMLLQGQGSHISLIVKDGAIVKETEQAAT